MNYAAHNKELQNSLLNIEAPVVFTKADSALLSGGKPFFIPAYTKRCDYETELCVRINHLGRSIPERFAHRYYDEVTVGIDFTARDLQEQLRQKGLPWDLCKGFDGSASTEVPPSGNGCHSPIMGKTFRTCTSTCSVTARRCKKVTRPTCSSESINW